MPSKKADLELLIEVEHYIDRDVRQPEAARLFRQRLQEFYTNLGTADEPAWQTVVVDSTTFMEIAFRKMDQYVVNKKVKDPRQWFNASANDLEELIMCGLGALPINVVVITHVDADPQDAANSKKLKGPQAPGRISKGLGASFAEQYRQFVWSDETGKRYYLLQTESDNQFIAGTTINAPDNCLATYESLWEDYKRPRKYIHALVTGEPKSGKSTFAATWPKPIKVWMFDPIGKEAPYLNVGREVIEVDDGLPHLTERVYA